MKNGIGQELSGAEPDGLIEAQRRLPRGLVPTVYPGKRTFTSEEIREADPVRFSVLTTGAGSLGKIAAERAIDNSKIPGKRWESVLPKPPVRE